MPLKRVVYTVLGAALFLSTVAFGDELVTLNATVGTELIFTMASPTGAVRCEVQTNTGFEFSLRPSVGVPSGIVQNIMSEWRRECSMHIRSPTIDQRGEWIIRAVTESSGQEHETVKRFLVQFPGQEEEHGSEEDEQHGGVGGTHYLPGQTLNGTKGIGLLFQMNSPTGVIQCGVITNTGVNFILFPRDDSTPSGIIQPFSSIEDGNCGMLIVTPTINDEGRWTIRAITNSGGARIVTVQAFQVQLERQAEDSGEDDHHDGVGHTHYLPGQTLNGTKGIGLLFEMNSPTGVIECEVVTNTGANFTLFPRDDSTPSGIIQPSSSLANANCGMLIVTPTISDEGRWTIRAITNSNGARIVTVQPFQVHLEMQEEDSGDDHHDGVGHTHYLPGQTLNGTKGIGLLFEMNSPTGVIECEVVTNTGANFTLFPRDDSTPSGIIQPSSSLANADCGMLIVTPTISDEGRWTIRAITSSSGARIVTVQPFQVHLEMQEEDSGDDHHDGVGHTHYLPGQTLNGTKGIGLLFEMNSPTGVVQCEVVTNIGANFTLFPRDDSTPSGIIQPSSSLANADCGMLIVTPTISDEGRWTIRAITNSNGARIVTVQPFQVHLEMREEDSGDDHHDGVGHTHYLPGQTLNGTKGIGLLFKMNSPTGVIECEVVTNTGANFTLFPRDDSTPSGIIQPSSSLANADCGMLIVTPTISDEGRWTIRAITSSSGARIVTVQPFQVHLEMQEEDSGDDHHDGVGHTHYLPGQTLNGTKGIGLLFEMNSPTGVVQCEVVTNIGANFTLFPRDDSTPSGIIQPSSSLANADCGMLIVTPTISDEGRWTIRAITNSNGARIVTVQPFQVHLEMREEDSGDDHHDGVGHTHYLPGQTLNGTKGIGLLFEMNSPTGVIECEVVTNTGANFTLFPRDDSTPSGIIQPSSSLANADCGMLIVTPTISDEGRWTIRAITNSSGARIVTVQPFQVHLEMQEEDSGDDHHDGVGHTHYLPGQTLNGTKGIGLLFEMNSPTGVIECEVVTNTGVNFTLFPRDDSTPSGIIQLSSSIAAGDCGMLVMTPTINDEGRWTIRAITNSNGVRIVTVQPFQVRLEPQAGYELVDVFPSRTISIFPGNSMSLRLRNRYDNLISCIATSPNGEKFDVLNDAASDKIRAFDQCGVTVRVNDEHSGLWRLDATIVNRESGNSLMYYGNFVVDVQNLSSIQSELTVIHVQRGESASITFGPSEAVSCQLRNPRGDYLPLSSGTCHADIPIVSDVHEGYWTAFYSLQGRMNVVEETTRVVVYDDRSFNATVTTSDNGNVNLLCRVRAYSLSFCQFVKPDGMVLNVFEGIGNDRYLYHGEGFQSTSMLTQKPSECGITILNPDASDYGNWKCILSTSSGLTGSILSVTTPGQNLHEHISVSPEPEHNVSVVKGESFTVKCEVNAELRYCWVGSPNGTTYLVSSTDTSPTTLRYSGMGLALGECGAVIPAAEYTDEGEWRCGMGVSNGQEVTSIVSVRVSDSILMPVARNATIRRNQPLQLSCSLIPAHQESIEYCRWVQPSGFGLQQWRNLDRSQNEVPNMSYNTESHCYLEIMNLRESQSVLGEWTCVAGLVGATVEVSATIEVIREPRHNSGFPSWFYYLVFTALALIIAIVAVVAVRAKDRMKNRRDQPPQYEVEKNFGIPSVITEKKAP